MSDSHSKFSNKLDSKFIEKKVFQNNYESLIKTEKIFKFDKILISDTPGIVDQHYSKNPQELYSMILNSVENVILDTDIVL